MARRLQGESLDRTDCRQTASHRRVTACWGVQAAGLMAIALLQPEQPDPPELHVASGSLSGGP